MRRFLLGRYPLWLLGAGLGGYSQMSWLLESGWRASPQRLVLGPLVGALLLWLLAEALAGAARYFRRDLWAQAARLGQFIIDCFWQLSALDQRRGRRAWLLGLLSLGLLASPWVYGSWLKPLYGAQQVRQYFLDNQDTGQTPGLRCLLYQGLDQAGPPRDLGPLNQFLYPKLDDLPGGQPVHFVLRGLGLIHIPSSGTYGFGGRVDDGLLLLIDGRVVVDAQMEGPARDVWGKVWLTSGWHAIDLRYLQYAGGAFLKLQWQPPGQHRQLLGQAQLRPLKAGVPLAPVTRLRQLYGLDPRPFSTYDPWQSGRHWDLPW